MGSASLWSAHELSHYIGISDSWGMWGCLLFLLALQLFLLSYFSFSNLCTMVHFQYFTFSTIYKNPHHGSSFLLHKWASMWPWRRSYTYHIISHITNCGLSEFWKLSTFWKVCIFFFYVSSKQIGITIKMTCHIKPRRS